MVDRIIFNDDATAIEIATRAKCYWDPRSCVSIARVVDGQLYGGVIFCGYTGESVGMHSAGFVPRWVNRDLLWVTFDFPFRQMGVKRIFGQVPENNFQARKLNEHLGFRYVTRIDGVFRNGEACLLMCLEKDDCRYLDLKPRHIQSNVMVEAQQAG